MILLVSDSFGERSLPISTEGSFENAISTILDESFLDSPKATEDSLPPDPPEELLNSPDSDVSETAASQPPPSEGWLFSLKVKGTEKKKKRPKKCIVPECDRTSQNSLLQFFMGPITNVEVRKKTKVGRLSEKT